MANILELDLTFTDGSTLINAERMNAMVNKINEVVRAVNAGGGGGTTVSAPIISVSSSSVTITAEGGATLRYTVDGSTPSASSGTFVNSNTVTFTPEGACTVKAVAIKDGVASSVSSQSYTPPAPSPEVAAVLAKFSNLTSSQSTKVSNFVESLLSSGVYEKIHYLAMPNVASSVAEALQNVLSSATPPAASNATISGGGLHLTSEGIISLTDLVNGTVDYDDIALCWGIEIDTSAASATNRAFTLDSAGSGTPSRTYFEKSTSNFIYKGYDGNKTLSLDGNTSICIMSHNKTALTEKYCDNSTGTITSNADTTSNIGNSGLSISTNKAQTSGSYNDYFSGVYKFIMLTDSLTDAQITALNTAVRTFLS